MRALLKLRGQRLTKARDAFLIIPCYVRFLPDGALAIIIYCTFVIRHCISGRWGMPIVLEGGQTL